VQRSIDELSPDDLRKLDLAHVLHPHSTVGRAGPPVVMARGKEATVWDVDGNEYVDATCGLWQCAVGHGREELSEVAAKQIRELEFYASFWDLSNEPAIRLAARLAELSPPGLDTVFYTNGGSEGVETAIKLVRRAWHAQGKTDRKIILSRKQAYHGLGSASLAATGIELLREGFDPLPPGFMHLSVPHERAIGPNAADVLIDELERTIEDIGSDRIAAFIGEPVIGVGGAIPPPEGYWPRVQQVLRRHGILLIADEVITAYGRTGHWFGSERYGIEPDMINTAKALTSGYFPMGAVLIGPRILELMDGTPFRHGFTYNGHPVGAAVALANLDIIEREDLVQRASQLGASMLARLKGLEDLPAVAEVRGVGMMFGIEIEEGNVLALGQAARDRGVIVRAAPPNIMLSPPLVVQEEQVDRIVSVLTEVLTEAS
jgi:adenosylmethionine-8-amino-7-oxononanoate aminotransferase